MLGMMMYGRETVVLEPARGGQQYTRILESLAVAEATGAAPLSEVIRDEGRRFGRHTTLIVISPSRDEEWPAALHELLRQGTRAAAILLEPDSFAQANGEAVDPGGPGLPTDELLAGNVATYIVPAQSDISLMLGPAGMVAGAAPERHSVVAR
jgi:hypothetical protein